MSTLEDLEKRVAALEHMLPALRRELVEEHLNALRQEAAAQQQRISAQE